MQRAEHQVAGLGRRQGQTDGLQVTHFADQDDVRVFAQRGAQRLGKAQGISMDLALIDQAALGLVDEFDRILDGQDVIRPVVVAVVDHRRQGRGLAGSGRTRSPAPGRAAACKVAEDFRCVQLIQAHDDRRNAAENGARAAVLVERIDAEAG